MNPILYIGIIVLISTPFGTVIGFLLYLHELRQYGDESNWREALRDVLRTKGSYPTWELPVLFLATGLAITILGLTIGQRIWP